ncbi:MAG: ferrous iron transport protein A [Desulfovibrionaceae bacterium]
MTTGNATQEAGAGMTLDELKPGQGCVIKSNSATGALGQRLLDLGFVPGAEIRVVRNAPLVDPVELELDGYSVSVRHDEARLLGVERI